MEQVAPGVRRIALRTPTLPPATHTNCYVLGERRLSIVEPASPWEDEQGRLLEALDALLAGGAEVERVVLTHHHVDHVGGVGPLLDALAARGRPTPRVVAHPETAARVGDVIPVDAPVVEGDALDCDGRAFDVLHTPGHAPGHVVLHDRESGAMIAGDMVAGVGTILIDPVEGDLGDYLASLERLRALGPTVLLPSHGPELEQAEAVLGFYVAHRHQRSEQLRQALVRHGPQRVGELVPRVYVDVDPAVWPIAEVQVLAHLRWMRGVGLAREEEDGRWRQG